jgi:beta-lactamase class A
MVLSGHMGSPMVSRLSVRPKRKKRPLPPGQKLLLLMLMSGICCFLTLALFRPQQNIAQQQPVAGQANAAAPISVPPPPFALTQPMGEMINLLRTRANQPNLNTGVFVVEPDTGRFIDINARRAYSAASMIKLPILVRLLQAIDQGTVKFDQKLTMRKDLMGGGSGFLQWRKPGTQVTLQETASLMMIFSDNTATNMVIDVLGGKEIFNTEFQKWGLQNTQINNWLPDLTGTNTTSPYDLATVLGRVDRGELISPESRAWLFRTLEHTRTRTLLPRGIPAGTKIADKTGDIGKLVGDAGIITSKDGKRYIICVSVERPFNDRRANALIRRISKDVYIGITGDTAGAATVVVDDEQKPVAKRASTSTSAPRRHHRRRRHR